uniref:molybdopterin molybdotransferase n=1 Tax=Geoglobus ahangari TaxID=113653 RepID=A0A7C4S4S4_9EURY
MKRKIFRDVLSVDEVFEKIKEFLPERKIEEVSLLNATGMIAAEDIYSISDVPPFDRATMDGFAVRADDTFGADEDNPVRLKVIGKIAAGDYPTMEVKRGEAVEIATGASMPKGANAVVMVEFTRMIGDFVEIFKPVSPGENVMSAGSDIMTGELIVRRGDVITHREIGVMAACGIDRVKVFKRPKIAVISTGNELIEVGAPLEYGKIYDVNSYVLCSAVRENGGEPIFIGIARDNRDDIKRLIEKGLRIADIVITSGGTSAGVGDIIYNILNEWEPGVLVHGIAIKPGKPTIIAVCDGKFVFGLPGYPTSALTIFEVFVAPLIRMLSGVDVERKKIRCKLVMKTFSSEGRREFLPVNIVKGLSGFTAYPVTEYYSGAITALAFTDGFVEIPENVVMLEEGEEVDVTLYSELKPADLIFIGSNCIGVEILLRLMRPVRFKIINVGSTGGILAVKRGEADIAGTHLLDESGEYNLPFLKRYGIKNAVLVKGYLREQGIIVAKGNPKGIRGIEDFLREDVTIINRNRGSGTRILLDMFLKEIAENEGKKLSDIVKSIKGYEIEAKTHSSVAVAVLSGKADAGLGIKTVATQYGLEFIPLRAEEYDFLIPKDRLEKREVKMFIEKLKSEDFKRELEKIDGLRVYERTGEIITIE